MKRLSRMLLIYWYSYNREVIEFGDINFLTGKTASGKSTIIDALQLVLLGDTNGNFFNKAANEKSVRTLRGYLFGETGDDGDTGYRYLRKGPFTSYVVLEFEDTEKNTSFLTGIVCDCYEDLNFDSKWFTVDKSTLPDDLFTDPKTNTPYTIRQLRSRLRATNKKRFDFYDTNKRFQEVILAKYGSVKRKYLTLLKKAVPFSPITDIEKFITESVCDVKNNIKIEQMQSDIRQYKNLESDALRTQERIGVLTEIAELTAEYENQKEIYKEEGYIILRARKEEHLNARQALEERLKEENGKIEAAGARISQLTEDLARMRKELDALKEEYLTSDIVKKQKMLEGRISEKKDEITRIRSAVTAAIKKVNAYGKTWSAHIDALEKEGLPVAAGAARTVRGMSSLTAESAGNYDFEAAASALKSLQETAAQYRYESELRREQIVSGMKELEGRIANLKKGIKPYPGRVMALKRKLESELFRRHKKTVEIPVFADLLEIRDPQWRNAIEGYLDRQKFNLLVPQEYYQDANEIYDAAGGREKLYDTGLVDIGRMRKEHSRRPSAGSLAEEIETDDADARLYADFLLGQVMKCENVRDLGKYRTAITKNVMLYKGYVSRRLNPARYADPFIGRRSMQILLENCEKEYEGARNDLVQTQRKLSAALKAASTEAMSAYEAQEHAHAVSRATELPELEKELKALNEEYDGLDFTYLSKMEEKINLKNKAVNDCDRELVDVRTELNGAQYRAQRIRNESIPTEDRLISETETEINENYDGEWIEAHGEPRFLKELGRGDRQKLTLLESFTSARKAAATKMERYERDRRRRRNEYNQAYQMPFDSEREDNAEYEKELRTLSDIRLPAYLDQIKDAREKAYNQFRDDFIAKLKSNIESVKQQIDELNDSLKNSVFGTDSYRFEVGPRAEYRNYYDMITDPMLMDTGGWNIASENFNAKYSREIDSLFKALIVNETDVSAERRAEYERNIRKFTDYKTYLVFDLIVTNDQGEKQRLSRTLLKKSGGETQIPFYIALLASFSQVCRIRSKGRNNTIRLIILDEAFSKMDGERIQESITLLRRFGLQAIFSAPTDKIPDIAPNVDRNIAVYRSGHESFTRYFDPGDISDPAEDE